MRLLALLPLLFCATLSAQSINAERSRFLSMPNGRTGTFAPYRLALENLDGIDTVTIHSDAPGVTLQRQVAVAGRGQVNVVLPVFVGEGATIRVAELEPFVPDLPLRRIQPDYNRPYVGVFSTDPVYARVLVPNSPRSSVCDYLELSEFFTDWRLFDGYDAIVIINPDETRLPPGSQRAIAEFCSLGGSALVIGSFRLGEKDVKVPAPAEPEVLIMRGVQVQRFAYGPGAIYRVGFSDLQRSQFAGDVVIDTLRDHQWFGADRAPGGTPPSRIAPQRAPYAPPLPPAEATPGSLFWALAGGLLLVTLLTPLIGARATKRVWIPQLVCAVIGVGLGGAGVMQTRPLPTLEVNALVQTGAGEAVSVREFLVAEDTWRATLEVNLDDESDRRLARWVSAPAGWNAWAVDRPLVPVWKPAGASATLDSAMLGDVIFRDFATQAHRGQTEFSTSDAYLLSWWLDENAYRGRRATVTPLKWAFVDDAYAGARFVTRGAIGVTSLRQGG